MGIFSKRAKNGPEQGESFLEQLTLWGNAEGYFDDLVVGTSHYQRDLSVIESRLRRSFGKGEYIKFQAVLCCEPDNPHDPTAVYVAPFIEGFFRPKVGYLPKERAAETFSRIARHGGAVACWAMLVGGGRTDEGAKKLWGLRLDMTGD